MTRRAWTWIAVAVAIGLIAVAFTVTYRGSATVREGTRQVVGRTLAAFGLGGSDEGGITYWCPMHPEVRRDRPGVCPICNMALVPLVGQADEADPGLLTLTDRQIQQGGVRVAQVLRRDLVQPIETSATILPDERRLAYATAFVEGRIERLYRSFRGETVTAGEPLVDLFSPGLIRSQQDFLRSLEEVKALGGASGGAHGRPLEGARTFVEEARTRLLRLGMTPAQVDELERTREVPEVLTIRAPRSGTILKKLVEPGDYVKEGSRLLAIADLSSLWLEVAVFEHEVPLVSVGDSVTLELRSFPGRTFQGTVAFVEPFVDPETRRVPVRVDLPNPEGLLRPGQYGEVRLLVPQRDVLAVPNRAVLRSGLRNVVIRWDGQGRLRPVEVRLGQQWLYPAPDEGSGEDPEEGLFGRAFERFDQVLAGLESGDVVVTSGAFLVNAEAQLQGTLVKMLPAGASLDQEPGAAFPPPSGPGKASPARALAPAERALREAYLTLGEALARDDADALPEAATALRASGQAVASADPELAEAAAEAASVLVGAQADLAEARRAFGALSRAMIDAARRDPAWLAGLEAFECPMADAFGFKLWLQEGSKLRNPYMGPAMLTCGSPAELETPAPPPSSSSEGSPPQAARTDPRGGAEPSRTKGAALTRAEEALRDLYLELAGELAADETGELAALAQRLSALSAQLRRPVAEAVREGARTLAGAGGDLTLARRAFGTLSRALLKAGQAQPALLQGLAAFECPMAEPFGFDRWLQPDGTDMENPYMGPAMLRCGSEVELEGDEPGPAPPPSGREQNEEAH